MFAGVALHMVRDTNLDDAPRPSIPSKRPMPRAPRSSNSKRRQTTESVGNRSFEYGAASEGTNLFAIRRSQLPSMKGVSSEAYQASKSTSGGSTINGHSTVSAYGSKVSIMLPAYTSAPSSSSSKACEVESNGSFALCVKIVRTSTSITVQPTSSVTSVTTSSTSTYSGPGSSQTSDSSSTSSSFRRTKASPSLSHSTTSTSKATSTNSKPRTRQKASPSPSRSTHSSPTSASKSIQNAAQRTTTRKSSRTSSAKSSSTIEANSATGQVSPARKGEPTTSESSSTVKSSRTTSFDTAHRSSPTSSHASKHADHAAIKSHSSHSSSRVTSRTSTKTSSPTSSTSNATHSVLNASPSASPESLPMRPSKTVIAAASGTAAAFIIVLIIVLFLLRRRKLLKKRHEELQKAVEPRLSTPSFGPPLPLAVQPADKYPTKHANSNIARQTLPPSMRKDIGWPLLPPGPPTGLHPALRSLPYSQASTSNTSAKRTHLAPPPAPVRPPLSRGSSGTSGSVYSTDSAGQRRRSDPFDLEDVGI